MSKCQNPVLVRRTGAQVIYDNRQTANAVIFQQCVCHLFSSAALALHYPGIGGWVVDNMMKATDKATSARAQANEEEKQIR